MSDVPSDSIAEQFDRDGYRSPLAVMSGEEAAYYRGCLEAYEARTGGPINGVRLQKPHLLFTWASEIIHRPQILDAVEEISRAGHPVLERGFHHQGRHTTRTTLDGTRIGPIGGSIRPTCSPPGWR